MFLVNRSTEVFCVVRWIRLYVSLSFGAQQPAITKILLPDRGLSLYLVAHNGAQLLLDLFLINSA